MNSKPKTMVISVNITIEDLAKVIRGIEDKTGIVLGKSEALRTIVELFASTQKPFESTSSAFNWLERKGISLTVNKENRRRVLKALEIEHHDDECLFQPEPTNDMMLQAAKLMQQIEQGSELPE